MSGVRGYFITILSAFISSGNTQEDTEQKNSFESKVVEMCEKNFEMKNRTTKAHPDPTPMYRYIMFGPVEFGKKTHRMHLHGYVYCTKQKSIKQLKPQWLDAHFDEAKGTGSDIENYCLKGTHDKEACRANPKLRVEKLVELGVKPGQGARTDLESALMENKTIGEFMDNEPGLFCRYKNGIEALYQRKIEKEKRYYEPVEVIWNYGTTGAGKTRAAFKDEECIDVSYDNGFFTDWHEAKKISLEEMNGQIPYKTLLKILDGYHNYYHVNIKGGCKLLNLKKIYISSSVHPAEIYKQQNLKEGSISQLLRRCTKINKFENGKIVDVKNNNEDYC